MKKTPLFYIGGCGHSGSTLLNIIFNTHSKVIGAGELKHYDPEVLNRRKCSCSKIAAECDFWSEVTSRLQSILHQEGRTIEDLQLNNTTYLSLRRFWYIWNLGYYSDQGVLSDREITKFNRDNAYLMKSMLEVGNKDIILDSSKSISRLFYLNQSDRFSIKVIYLVRNGKALINSWRNRQEPMSDQPNYKSALHWTIRNLRMQKLIRENLNDDQVIQIHYENFTSNPETTLYRICNFVGIGFEDEMLNYAENVHHVLSGNPMARNPRSDIVFDSSWKKNISCWDEWVFNFIGGLMNKKLGY